MARDQWARIELRGVNRLTAVARKSFLVASEKAVLMSPVDKALFKNNWFTEINSITSDTTASTSRSGSSSLSGARSKASILEIGDSISFANALPYAVRLENGWSDFARDGIVKVIASEWQNITSIVVREVRNDRSI